MIKKVTTGYKPRPLQAEIHRKMKRFNVLILHRRFGKTHLALNELIDRGLTCKNKNPQLAYIAPTYGQAKRVAWDILKEYIKDLPFVEINESELRIDIQRPDKKDRVRIMLLGAENPNAILGIYLDWVVLDEYADINPEVWGRIVRPLLADRMGGAIFIGTPRGTNHFYQLYQEAKENPDWYTCVYKASETNIIPRSELEASRASMSESEYLQEFECFVPGTMITTSRGNMPIETIRVGDSVLTHRNRFHVVTNTMNKNFSGTLIKVSYYGSNEPLLVTEEHPFLVYDRQNNASRSWVRAKDLDDTMYLVTPKMNKKKPIVSEDFIKLIAWYLTEGSVNGNSVTFSLNQNNYDEQNEVTSILDRLGYKYKFYKGTCAVLVVCSTALADTLVSLCGSLADNKRVPFDLIFGYERLFFDTMIKGDGCTIKREDNIKWYMYTTISKGLAYDIQTIAASLGRRSRVSARKAYIGNIEGREVNCRKSYSVRISYKFKVNHSSLRHVFPTKLGIASKITKVESQKYQGKVYNLSVKQDESYVANGIAVHNCSFSAALVGAYYGKDLEAIDSKGRISGVPYDPALPVHTAWDLGIDDTTSIWFVQVYGKEVRLIDYEESSGAGLDYWVKLVSDKPYRYESHIFPHDIGVRELTTGKTRLETIKKMGMRNVKVATKISLEDGINAVRMLLPKCWFDSVKTKRGVEALRNYQRKWDSKNKVFQARPLHDWSSHGADAFRTLAVGLKDDSGYRDDYQRYPRKQDNEFEVV